MGTETSVFRGLLFPPNCAGCPFEGQKIVPPEGNPCSTIMLIGEGPGGEEEAASPPRPFIGRSGKLLDHLLERNGIKREDVWVDNAVLCRPRPAKVPRTVVCATCRNKKKAVASCGACSAHGLVPTLVQLDDKQALAEAVPHCRDRLLATIGLIRPRVVVPLGRYALDTVLGYKTHGILKHRGAIHQGKVPVRHFDEAAQAAVSEWMLTRST